MAAGRRGSNADKRGGGGPDLLQHQLAADSGEEYKQLQQQQQHHHHHHSQHHSYRDLDMLNSIHTNISRLVSYLFSNNFVKFFFFLWFFLKCGS